MPPRMTSSSAFRAPVRWALLGLLAVSLAACGDDGGGQSPDAARAAITVMVIDHGFDPTHPGVKDKIAAAYTLECQRPDAGAGDDGGAGGDGGAPPDARPPFAVARAAFLDELSRPDETCRLQPGIAARPNPFADLEAQRAGWNAAIRRGQLVGNPFAPSPLDALFAKLVERLQQHPFHGTATAGIIAQDNPAVRLVLVERPLGDGASIEEQFTCILQEEIDEALALLSDPEVRAAYRARPIATADRDLAAAASMHGVVVVNESFGHLSRHALEGLQRDKRCPPVQLRPYFARMVELDRGREQDHPRRALVAKAAGNDGALIDGPEDSLDCRPGDPGLLLVGSYGSMSVRSRFSNFGACVDAYAPGEEVIAPLPGDWVFPLAGTSFSTPMAVRLATLTAPAPFTPDTVRAALVAMREPNRNLPLALFPESLVAYARRKPAGQALTVDRAHTPRLPGISASHPSLWPLRWVQRHGRR
jgi:subtilisin family serine protease